ncbi:MULTISPECIES: linear amide C-N hydrolase [Providencia]|uniref:Linear amide C-N hydrolase n=1 Tax=Providencia rettgeri TaxID=587 RepID=A0AAJ6G0E8_PRORE|nr:MULTISPECIES: linear amide C-N hydrolase [Providencia]ELR5166265.1 linear amide C-N hydrolase [Providencia rettgeri]WHT81766.1 linear amide C-N hydrolase [Providencia rettgeri]WHT95899.1 linear amide C-N hydrolase [Providencia rettgeri]WJM88264.1 linear amide C-N hydrolase [Providencia rettgeri]
MKLEKTLMTLISSFLAVSMTSQACSSLAILDKSKNVYHGRTLELSEHLPSWITYYPRNTHFQKKAPNGQNGLSYSSKYDILAISTDVYFDGNSHDILQGLNNAGLSFSLNMITEAELAPINNSDYSKSIPVTAMGEWALANFSNVDEVKTAVESGFFWAPDINNFGKSPFHYAFYDRKGGSIVIEALNGRLHVYDNPTRVMTNGPDFSWHLKNLNNYSQLTNLDHSSATLGNIIVTQPDSGIATSDLPSSNTSVGRFIRAVYYSSYAEKASSSSKAINTLAHIMNRFDRSKNITIDRMGESGKVGNTFESEYTVWTSLSDLTNGVMLIRGYNDVNYTSFSISRFEKSKKPVFEKINTGK